jgi:hypothetical protein
MITMNRHASAPLTRSPVGTRVVTSAGLLDEDFRSPRELVTVRPYRPRRTFGSSRPVSTGLWTESAR